MREVLDWNFTGGKKKKNKYLLLVLKEWNKWDLEEKILIPILLLGVTIFFIVIMIDTLGVTR